MNILSKSPSHALGRTRFEPILTTKQAAELLQCHPKTVQKRAKAGLIKGRKTGREWLFRESDLDEWFRAGYISVTNHTA